MHTKILLALLVILSGLLTLSPLRSGDEPAGPELTTIALRVHNMDAMTSFYSQAFGIQFEAVDTQGITSQFGTMRGGILLKFVPLREAADFEGWPSHQLGFEVFDVNEVIALAEEYGGLSMGEVMEEDGRAHGAVRDPDGNSIELYSHR